MTSNDLGIVANYLIEEYASIPNGSAIVTTLRGIIDRSKNRYVLENDEGLLIGYYVYSENTEYTAELSSVFIAPKYRHTKYAKELWKHGAELLHGYRLVKCYTSYNSQIMPTKYYDNKRNTFDMKKLHNRFTDGK